MAEAPESADPNAARKREAATREILDLIGRSRDDEAPVFEAILHRAANLCGASAAALVLGKASDSVQRLAGHYGVDPATIALYDRGEVSMNPDISLAARAILTGTIVHIEDMMDTDGYRSGVGHFLSVVQDTGIRTNLFVPLLTPAGGIGCLIIFRKEVRPYTPDEIALVETFAAQAVIAIENARQFRELQDSLEQQEATSDILRVISQSREDETQVFDLVLEKAAVLCDADQGSLVIVNEARTHVRLMADWGHDRTAWQPGAEFSLDLPLSIVATIRTAKVVHIEDYSQSDAYRDRDPIAVGLVETEGHRTRLIVPLLQNGIAIGCISLSRRTVRPFTPDEIALVETFAAQAVIAIENVRQFRELQTRLAREAATREILEVISQSRDDDRPVFDMVLRKAAQLCDASLADLCVISEDRSYAVVAAHWGEMEQQQISVGDPIGTMDSQLAIPTCMREGRIVEFDDLADTDLYRSGDPIRVTSVDKEGIRTFLAVPLLSGGRAVGCIAIYRLEVRPFTADQIALVETFAAQAVIAIENVRQFRELQTRLEREAATRDILEVISQSRDDDTPVFDMIALSAARLCRAAICTFWRVEDGLIHYCASHGLDHASLAVSQTTPAMPLLDNTLAGQVVKTRAVAQIEDATAESYFDHEWAREQGLKHFIGVPIFVRDEVWGSINLHWPADRTPREADIALVETFAAQAVIAIDNVRQFRELQTRLEREAATREILSVISQSRDDDAPVFDVIVRNAARLCNAPMAWLMLAVPTPRTFMIAGYHGLSRRQIELGDLFELDPEPDTITGVGRAIFEAQTNQDEDLALTRHYLNDIGDMRMIVDEEGIRTRLNVPLVSGGAGIGAILLTRREVAPFTPDQIALVETFAAQAVIAIENVRQFRELQTRLAHEAATREILEVISQSRDDDRPVFEAILRRAASLCDSPASALVMARAGDLHLRLVAQHGVDPATVALYDRGEVPMDPEISYAARAILTGQVVHLDDMLETANYRRGVALTVTSAQNSGVRTIMFVPLVTATGAIGSIDLFRTEVRPYTPDEIALVETFAAQAVIAIENVRQFRELQTRLAREAATREILEVISQSRDDDAPVFDAVLRNANRLCGTSMAYLVLGRPDDAHMTLAAYVNPYLPSEDSVDEIIAFANQTGMRMDAAEHFSARAIVSGEVVQIADIAASHGYLSGEPTVRILVEDVGVRTVLSVPLFDAQGAIGAISLQRREVRPFSDDEIALIQSFAAQAGIAIENVRQFRELQTRLAREAATREILQIISQSRNDEGPVFDVILENACQLCNTPMADLILARVGDTHQVLAAEHGAKESAVQLYRMGGVPMDPAQSYGAQAILERKVIHLANMAESDLYRNGSAPVRHFVDDEGIRTILFVPLIANHEGIGVIALFRYAVDPFDADEIALVETFAAQAVIAIENVRQFKALEALNAELGDRVQAQVGEIERMGRLKRFLPPAVADAVVSSGSDRLLSSHRALLGVLFCDIRGFTAFCETAEPEETIEVLQTYHEEMGRLIEGHGAGVDHRMGDGIMVLFNDPLPCDDPAGSAVRLAMAMRERMAELCQRWKKMGHRLGFGVGVSLGYATVGMVGSAGRFDYTASGTAINLASRLGDEAQDGEILLSPRARMAVEGDFTTESRGEITLKGIREPVEVFRVTGSVQS